MCIPAGRMEEGVRKSDPIPFRAHPRGGVKFHLYSIGLNLSHTAVSSSKAGSHMIIQEISSLMLWEKGRINIGGQLAVFATCTCVCSNFSVFLFLPIFSR